MTNHGTKPSNDDKLLLKQLKAEAKAQAKAEKEEAKQQAKQQKALEKAIKKAQIEEAKAEAKQEKQIARAKARKKKKIQIANKLLKIRINTLSNKISNDITKAISTDKTEFIIKLDNKIKEENRFKYFKKIFNDIIDKTKDNTDYYLWIKAGGNRRLPLSINGIKNILAKLEGEIVGVDDWAKGSGTQTEIIIDLLETNEPIVIEITKKAFKNKLTTGAFFPYYSIDNLFLRRYQIKSNTETEETENIFKYNCLIYAFKLLGMADADLIKCENYINNRNIAQKELKELSEELKINLIIHTIRNNEEERKIQYGNKEGITYNIALHSQHYFIYDTTKYTKFFIKNYELLKNEKEPFNIVGYQQGSTTKYQRRPETQKTYFINSLKLVDTLVKNKDSMLIKMTHQTIKENDEIYSLYKLKDNFDNMSLEYNINDSTTKLIEFDEEKAMKKKDKYKNYEFIVADFETYDDKTVHTPYLLNGSYLNFDTKTLYDKFSYSLLDYKNIIESFFDSINKDTVLIFHNAKFDYNFIVPYLSQCSEVINDGNFILFNGRYGKYNIVIKCSYKLITAPLKDFPKMFNLGDAQKELIHHPFYNRNNIFIKYHDVIKYLEPFNDEEKIIVLDNAKKWQCITDDKIDIIKYSKNYCDMDVELLGKGYLIFRKWILEYFDEDINGHLTIPSIITNIFMKQGIFKDCFELSGLPREFITKAMVGGRCMTANNEKHDVNLKINDLDATSLYPTAMTQIKGFVKGRPKPLLNHQLNQNFINSTDYYFVSIKILKVNKFRRFPLLRRVIDGKNTHTNEMEGEIVFLGKTALEDAVEFQNIEYEIISGYYFNEGFNTDIKELINEIFERRKTLKKEENPAELIMKLLMNSSYGKLLQKPPNNEILIMDDKNDDINIYKTRNYATIKALYTIDKPNNTNYQGFKNKVRIEKNVAEGTFHNKIHLGIMILDESKRIMNQVMTLAEDNGINIYYQDTDSMQLEDGKTELLEQLFYEKYNRKLVGKDLRQFSSDFKPSVSIPLLNNKKRKIKNIYATQSYFVGKKAYINKLEIECEEGKIWNGGFHTRCKGVNEASIEHLLKQPEHRGKDVLEIYKGWYNGAEYSLDLTAGETVCSMNINLKNNTITNRKEFIRNIKFV
jgi:hypothetical protein